MTSAGEEHGNWEQDIQLMEALFATTGAVSSGDSVHPDGPQSDIGGESAGEQNQAVDAALFDKFTARVKARTQHVRCSIEEFLRRSVPTVTDRDAKLPSSRLPGTVMLDVRSPKEFEQGHIPGAVNAPLFDNMDRHTVGLSYKEDGKLVAIQRGLCAFGARLDGFVEDVRSLTGEMQTSNEGTSPANENQQSHGIKDVTVYCFRGRMRSAAITFLLMSRGVRVTALLEGGYKGFRGWALAAFPTPTTTRKALRSSSQKKARKHQGVPQNRGGCTEPRGAEHILQWGDDADSDDIGSSHEIGGSIEPMANREKTPPWGFRNCAQKKICVITGLTGSGKTRVLSALGRLGERVIDLEGLANHCGSAFGWVGYPGREQPTPEQFENDLSVLWWQLMDGTHWIFLEDEGSHIGRIFLPRGFYTDVLRNAPLIVRLEVPTPVRVQLLLEDYASPEIRSEPGWSKRVADSCRSAEKRLGTDRVNRLLQALEEEQYRLVIEILLGYYDGMYDYHIKGIKEKERKGEACGRPGATVNLPVCSSGGLGFDADQVALDVLKCLALYCTGEREVVPNTDIGIGHGETAAPSMPAST